MGFFGELGKFAGTIAGGVVGGATELVGEIVGSDFIKEVGQGVNRASINAGKTVGQAADGVAGIAKGIITKDSYTTTEGLDNLGDAVGRTATGMVKGVGYIAKNGVKTVEGVIEGDNQKALNGAKNLAKVALISTIAFGVADYLDIVDFDGAMDAHDVADAVDIDGDGIIDIVNEYSTSDIAGIHHVQPHYVQSHISGDNLIEGYWRDGDGNPDIDLIEAHGGGYIRSNPDGSTLNNLG